jgi:hypothetical protein
MIQLNAMFDTLKFAQEIFHQEGIHFTPFVTTNENLLGAALLQAGLDENNLGSLIRRLGDFEEMKPPTDRDLTEQIQYFGKKQFGFEPRGKLIEALAGRFTTEGLSGDTKTQMERAKKNARKMYTAGRIKLLEELKGYFPSLGIENNSTSLEGFAEELIAFSQDRNHGLSPSKEDRVKLFIEFLSDFFKRNAVGVFDTEPAPAP